MKTYSWKLFFLICFLYPLLRFPEAAAQSGFLQNSGFGNNFIVNELNVNNGLTQNSVTSIVQDKRGFIWAGTYDGLNRFDGINVRHYRHLSGDAKSISDNRILTLYSDDAGGDLFIGTEGEGIVIYNWRADSFDKIELLNKQNKIATVNSICKDQKGKLWAAGPHGLAVLAPKNNGWLTEVLQPFKQGEIKRLYCDRAGNIWVGSTGGLFLIRPAQTGFGPEKVRDGDVHSIFQDKDGVIWYGGYGNLGMIKLLENDIVDVPTCRFLKSDLFKASSNLLLSGIVQDMQGIIWLATNEEGLIMCDINKEGFYFIKERFNSEKPYNSISEYNLNCVFIDRANSLWIGTFQNGVNYINLNQKNIFSFIPLMNSRYDRYVSALALASNKLWIGTLNKGLLRYNFGTNELKETGSIKSRSILSAYAARNGYVYIGGNEGLYAIDGAETVHHLLSSIDVRSICEDNYKRLWLATWSGIIVYDIVSGQKTFITEKNGLSSNKGYVLKHDKNSNTVWYGTIGGGLNKIGYDEKLRLHITSFRHSVNKSSLSNNHVWCLYQDNENKLWAGTDAGLNIVDGERVTHITHPLINNRKITSVLKDRPGNLWISTGQGLVEYNLKENTARLYTYNDGLLSNTLTEASLYTANDLMFIGSINGINAFSPSVMEPNPYAPQTSFTAIKINDKEVFPGEKIDNHVLIKENIDAVQELVLDYNQNNFAIQLAALHYASPGSNQFRYKLEGYDKDWKLIQGNPASISVSHLKAGKYKLLVSTANNSGLWNPEYKKLSITVKPAPWLTWWAKLIYLLLFGTVVWFIYGYYDAKRRIKNQAFVERYEKEKLKELNELKLDFFTKITHELRTPLNLILGPANDLIQSSDQPDYISKRADIIHRNALRLYNLINQVLDLRKISGNAESLNATEENLFDIVAGVKNSFALLAESRGINLVLKAEKTDKRVWVDKNKIEKVLYNIISNAFNASEDNKPICVLLSYSQREDGPWASVSIEDEGRGIGPDETEHIFDMYYQAGGKNGIGSGIGLAVAKKLVEIQKGTIEVKSILGEGAVFTVDIPVGRLEFSMPEEGTLPIQEEDLVSRNQAGMLNNTGKDCILVVDDDTDLLEYIAETLNDYTVIKSDDAKEALALAKKFQPQLIVSDLVMPGMDGEEFLKLLKKDIQTSHIPVFIHSVKYDMETAKEVLKGGADDFIQKPVNYRNLKSKIKNVLLTRQNLIDVIHKGDIITPKIDNIPSADEDFLKNVFSCIEKNISNPDFSVEKLSSEMAMSRMSLHRKLDTIIGKTASQLIREVRMKVAGQLLASGSYRISEVMDEVGIYNNHYFNKYFKEMYHMSSKEYIAMHKKNTD